MESRAAADLGLPSPPITLQLLRICRSLVLIFHTPLKRAKQPTTPVCCLHLQYSCNTGRQQTNKPKLQVPSVCFALFMCTKQHTHFLRTSSNRMNHASEMRVLLRRAQVGDSLITSAYLQMDLSRCTSARPALHTVLVFRLTAMKTGSEATCTSCRRLSWFKVLMSHFPLPSPALTITSLGLALVQLGDELAQRDDLTDKKMSLKLKLQPPRQAYAATKVPVTSCQHLFCKAAPPPGQRWLRSR